MVSNIASGCARTARRRPRRRRYHAREVARRRLEVPHVARMKADARACADGGGSGRSRPDPAPAPPRRPLRRAARRPTGGLRAATSRRAAPPATSTCAPRRPRHVLGTRENVSPIGLEGLSGRPSDGTMTGWRHHVVEHRRGEPGRRRARSCCA